MSLTLNGITYAATRTQDAWCGPADFSISAETSVQLIQPADAADATQELRGNLHGEIDFTATCRCASASAASALCMTHALAMTGASGTLTYAGATKAVICQTCKCNHKGATVFATYKLVF